MKKPEEEIRASEKPAAVKKDMRKLGELTPEEIREIAAQVQQHLDATARHFPNRKPPQTKDEEIIARLD